MPACGAEQAAASGEAAAAAATSEAVRTQASILQRYGTGRVPARAVQSATFGRGFFAIISLKFLRELGGRKKVAALRALENGAGLGGVGGIA